MAICERSNARKMTRKEFERLLQKKRPALLGEASQIDMLMMDVSFTSVLPIVQNILTWDLPIHDWVIMIKPQFEAEKEELPKGAVIKDEELRQTIVKRTITALERLGFTTVNAADSGVMGPKGNLETFWHGILSHSDA